MHSLSNSDTGTGFVLALPRMSIQHEKTYFTPAFSKSAFAWSALPLSLPLILVALTLAASGTYAAIGTFWSLPTSILTGTGAAAGLALINSMGNVSGLVGPPIIGALKQETGTFAAALLFLSGVLIVGAAIVLLFGAAERARSARPRAAG